MKGLEALIRRLRDEAGLDPRTAVFDVRSIAVDGELRLIGQTTEPAVVDGILAAAAARGAVLQDEVLRLPEPDLGDGGWAIVSAALAPLHGEASLASTQISQAVMGHQLEILHREGPWCRVRGADGYIAWVHEGYLTIGSGAWSRAWLEGEGGEVVVSLGAELVDADERMLARLPWGARVIREGATRVRLPDGRFGALAAGELVPEDRLGDWFPRRGESVVRTARRWVGTPYVWGGITLAGADCSGFVQAVYRLHGALLPRDSDLHQDVGTEIDIDAELATLRPGDLLYFGGGIGAAHADPLPQPGRVSHVAISLGGASIIHAALIRGGVATEDLLGTSTFERRLKAGLRGARRIFPD
jgi:gamma-D-glutamyl-L-lysine dipeptidyl-peptidase